jgi:hypothetical protein
MDRVDHPERSIFLVAQVQEGFEGRRKRWAQGRDKKRCETEAVSKEARKGVADEGTSKRVG